MINKFRLFRDKGFQSRPIPENLKHSN
jgi:hypothetical protein